MEIAQLILPLVGVMIGAILSGIGAYFRGRIERKRMISLALTDLLEVRHHICGVELVIRELRKRFNVTADATPTLRALIEQITPVNTDVHRRYDCAVSLLAGIDPLLAFNLRSKNTLPNLLSSLRSIAEPSGLSMEALGQVEGALRVTLAPHLDKAVIDLAGKHSFITQRKVVKLIEKSRELPPEVDCLFEQFAKIAALSAQQKAA